MHAEWTWRWTKSGAVMGADQGAGCGRGGALACALQEVHEEGLLRVQAVLRLLVYEALGSVEDLVGHLEVATDGHGVHEVCVVTALQQGGVHFPVGVARAAARVREIAGRRALARGPPPSSSPPPAHLMLIRSTRLSTKGA